MFYQLSSDFDLVDLQELQGELHLYLDEFNLVPEEFSDKNLVSKG